MPRISANTENRIKDAANIVDVLKHYGINLTRVGAGYVAICPFHPDRRPSMQVSPSKGICKCFACNTPAMDAIRFIRRYENIDYPTALTRLADICRIPIEYETGERRTPQQPSRLAAQQPHQETPGAPPPPPPSYHPRELMLSTERYTDNPLYQYTCTLFRPDAVTAAFKLYHVGTSKSNGRYTEGTSGLNVIFWQVDAAGRVRAGKVLRYDSDTGHRIKSVPPNWVHKVTGQADYNPVQCLFGEHLIAGHTRINIVESEKTAIWAHLFYGNKLGAWIATGGKSMLTADKIAATPGIAECKVVLYPDADGVATWRQLTAQLQRKGLDAQLSDVMSSAPADSKQDIGDWIAAAIIASRAKPEPGTRGAAAPDEGAQAATLAAAPDEGATPPPYAAEMLRTVSSRPDIAGLISRLRCTLFDWGIGRPQPKSKIIAF